MYVFGGCTQSSCNAAFNDLWRLDLNSKEWIRPLASGMSPSQAVKTDWKNKLQVLKKTEKQHTCSSGGKSKMGLM